MSDVNAEFAGGPMDGWRGPLTNHHADGPLPAVELTDGTAPGLGVMPELGRYVLTRKLSREGRLIYEFRGATVEAGRCD